MEFFGDEIERILEIDPLTGEMLARRLHAVVFPATHYVTPRSEMERAIEGIAAELEERLRELRGEGKLLEAQRLEQRTRYDLEMMREMGYCQGIENYSRHLTGRPPGEPPYSLLDFFPAGLPGRHRRVPRDHPPAQRHVRRGPLPQAHPGGVRLPAALGPGQPAAALRGVRGQGGPGGLRLGHARAPTNWPGTTGWWSRSSGPPG